MSQNTWPLRIFQKSNDNFYLANDTDVQVSVINDCFKLLKVQSKDGNVFWPGKLKRTVREYILERDLNANAYETLPAYFNCFSGEFECEIRIYAVAEPKRTEPLPQLEFDFEAGKIIPYTPEINRSGLEQVVNI